VSPKAGLAYSAVLITPVTAKHRVVKFQQISLSKR